MMHHNTQGQHKEGLVDRAKDMLHMGHKEQTGQQNPYVDPAVPYDKQNRYGNEDYLNQGGTPGAAYDTTPGYDPIAAKEASGKAYGTSTGVVGTETGTGSAYTTPAYGTAEYGVTGTGVPGALSSGTTYGTGHPDKAAVLDSYGAIVTEQSHLTAAPVDPLAHPAVIGVDAAAAHGAPVIPSTYNVDHTAHTTGPVVGAVDHTALGTTTAGYDTAAGTTHTGVDNYNAGTTTTTGTGVHSTTATTGSTGTEHEKKGFMANIKEKIHDVTDKLHHRK